MSVTPDFVDNFDGPGLDTTKWQVSNWSAPGNNPEHVGLFRPENVQVVDGCLRLELNQYQETVDGKATSYGGEVKSLQTFGYGEYQIRARAGSNAPNRDAVGSPVEGGITGIFNWITDSETEIDIEMEGIASRAAYTQSTTWNFASQPNEHYKHTLPGNMPHEQFYDYTIIWASDKIEYYRDGVLFATHTTVVPTEPAPFLFNHWGTSSIYWGGMPSFNTPRYMYIDRFAFIAAT